LIGIHREVFESIGGFDEGIANHLIEADICLSAKDKGYPVKYLPDCLGFVYKETFVQSSRAAEPQTMNGR
jgi:GT2 family glycosyltransferase